MTEIRKNEFMDMLEMNDLLFVEHEHFIQSNIPKIGNVNYYPKADKLQIHKTISLNKNFVICPNISPKELHRPSEILS